MKKWLRIYLTALFGILASIGVFNYFMDPLWCFSHKNSFQSCQGSFNERQQKLNLMHFQPFNYDGLFIGSSRITIHDPSTLSIHGKTFNLALDAMYPNEFNEYIEYAKKRNQQDFKYIIIGLDFVAVGKNQYPSSINEYLKKTTSSYYKYKTLFSYDSLNRSIKNFKYSVSGKYKKSFKTYDQNHIAHTHSKGPQAVEEIITTYVTKPRENLIYDRVNYINIIQQLKVNNPNTKFIVFTTPLPEPELNQLLKTQAEQDTLHQWLTDIYHEFGPFWHFLNTNVVTQKYKYYFVDDAHYTSEIANCINRKISNQECKNPAFKNFGIYISNQNTLDAVTKDITK